MNAQNETRCPETVSTLILYLYGEADDPRAFETHLKGCAECRTTLENHKRVLGAYRAETVAVPQAAALPSRASLWDNLRHFFRAPEGRPLFTTAAAAVALALVAFVAVRVYIPAIFYPNVPSYAQMESDMDSIDTDLDSLFASNDFSDNVVDSGLNSVAHEGLSNLDSDLDEIQYDAQNF